MEMVEFAGYTEREKAEIAKKYLIPRQLEESGLGDKNVSFTDDAVMSRRRRTTRARAACGSSSARSARWRARSRAASRRATAGDRRRTIDADEVRELLGRPKVHPERAAETNEVGIATGMYYTPMGGDIMFVEASIRRYYGGAPNVDQAMQVGPGGAVSLILTGQLGDVMKESARAAFTYATNNAATLGIPKDRLRRDRGAHPRAGRRHPEGWPVGRHRDRDGAGVGDVGPAGAARRRDDGRDHAARPRAADRRPEGEGARRAPRGHQDDHPAEGERGGHRGRAGGGAKRCSSSIRWRRSRRC